MKTQSFNRQKNTVRKGWCGGITSDPQERRWDIPLTFAVVESGGTKAAGLPMVSLNITGGVCKTSPKAGGINSSFLAAQLALSGAGLEIALSFNY